MRYFRRSRTPNVTVGIFLLLVLAMLASPNVLPRIIADIFPEVVYSGVPCAWLRRADQRAYHQSLLGRDVDNPFELTVDTSPLPSDGSGFLVIRITIRNNSLGTVPLVYNNQTVMIGDNGTTGLGVLFTPQNSLNNSFARSGEPATFPETDIHLLGPRQSCVHDMQLPGGNVLIDPALTSGTAQVRAYYRGTTRGTVVANAVATPIYNDQGLWTGYVESEPAVISRAAAAP